ncbi:hypothetical protein ACWDTG_11140 [Rhodococcus zopfii]
MALELQVKRRETLDDLPEPDAEQIVKWWENASDARRRDVISVLLDHVTVKSTRRRGPAGLDPERLQRVWR